MLTKNQPTKAVVEKILLIEDDPGALRSLELLLEANGFKVVAASTGLEAIEKAQESEFALVIADVRMPGIDGIETLGRLGVFQPQARKIVITGYAGDDAPVRAIQVSVDDYLMKPFGQELFLKSVASAISRYQLEREKARAVRDGSQAMRNLVQSILGRIEKFSGHEGESDRLSDLCTQVGEKLELGPLRLEKLKKAALLHNLGFLNPEPEKHGTEAAEILRHVSGFEDAAPILSAHHEPGHGDLLEARILALCERWEQATTSEGLLPQEALNHLSSQFEPELLEALSHQAHPPRERERGKTTARGKSTPAESLLHLAHIYSLIGETEMARSILSRIEGLKSSLENEEFLYRLRLISAQNLIREQRFWEGYQQGEKGLEIALSLNLGPAQVVKAFLEMCAAKLLLSDTRKVEEMMSNAVEVFEGAGDWRNLARAFLYLGVSAFQSGQRGKGASFLERCRSLLRPDAMAEWLQGESLLLKLLPDPEVSRLFALSAVRAEGLRIHCLGPFRVYRDGVLLKEEEWKSRKMKVLLAYLLFNHDKPVSEDRLCEILWPDADFERSRKNLHQTVYLLRRLLEPGLSDGSRSHFLLSRRGGYQFGASSPSWWDVNRFKKCAEEAESFLSVHEEEKAIPLLREAEDCYQGDLLEDFPEESWCDPEGDKLREIYFQVLLRLASYHEKRGRHVAALDYSSRILAREPLHEEGALQHIRSLFGSGQRSEAIRRYRDWTEKLKREMNLPPPPELVSLYLQMTGAPTEASGS